MFRKATNIATVVLVALFLCGTVGLKAACELGVHFPEWLGVGLTSSNLEGRNYQGRPTPTSESILAGRFQSSLEKYITDLTPMRDNVILANAALERACIEAANVPFGWESYPTYFDSQHYVYPAGAIVFAAPAKTPPTFWENASSMIEGFSQLMKKHTEINWVFFLADSVSTSSASPAMQYSTSVCDLSYYAENIQSILPENCTFINGEYTNLNDLLSDYMATDHHWNVHGATKAYSRIIRAYGKEPVSFTFYEAFDGPCFGSAARAGLCLNYPQPMVDVEYQRSPLHVVVGDSNAVDESFLDKGFGKGAAALSPRDKTYNSYASWFHPMTPFFTITNDSIQNGTLLIINDSFGNNMQRFFAEHYHTVHVIDPRHYEGSLEAFIVSHEIDDALILTSNVMLFETLKSQL